MTATDARFENDLPSVIEAKDLDAQTAEKLRSSSFSGSNSDEGSAAEAGRGIRATIQGSEEYKTLDLGNQAMLYRPDPDDGGFWKNPESPSLRDIGKCLFNNWEDRQDEAREKLGGHIDNLVPREHRERMQDMHKAVIEGNINRLSDAIKDIPPHQLKNYLKDINQHLKDSDSDVRMTVTSRGNVLVYSKDEKSAVEVDPRTGDATERAIVGMTKSIPPQLIFGDVEPGDPKDALERIGDEVTRDTTFGKEDLVAKRPFLEPLRPGWGWDEPIKPSWGWDDPIWHRPIRWNDDEPSVWKPHFYKRWLLMDSSSSTHELHFKK